MNPRDNKTKTRRFDGTYLYRGVIVNVSLADKSFYVSAWNVELDLDDESKKILKNSYALNVEEMFGIIDATFDNNAYKFIRGSE